MAKKRSGGPKKATFRRKAGGKAVQRAAWNLAGRELRSMMRGGKRG